MSDSSGASGPLLETDGLVAGYVEEVDILNGVSIEVREGEIVTIVGPNGAGKSTLIKTIFGLLTPRAGHVLLRGEDIGGQKPHAITRKGMSYVPQLDNVFPSLTVEENLEMGAVAAHGVDKRGRIQAMYDLFPRLAERRRQSAGTMSGGERQMVAMARALMPEPGIVLLDEPSAGLSPALQDQVFVRCRRINQEGVAILMVEQNARRCLQVVHRGYVLDQGQNAYTGTGRALLSDPNVIELYLGTLARASGGGTSKR